MFSIFGVFNIVIEDVIMTEVKSWIRKNEVTLLKKITAFFRTLLKRIQKHRLLILYFLNTCSIVSCEKVDRDQVSQKGSILFFFFGFSDDDVMLVFTRYTRKTAFSHNFRS